VPSIAYNFSTLPTTLQDSRPEREKRAAEYGGPFPFSLWSRSSKKAGSRDHNSGDERGDAGKQQKFIEKSGHF